MRRRAPLHARVRGRTHPRLWLPPGVPTSDEDGAYLRVLRLLRSGREDEARAAAKDYLRRFPTGFRREEMQQLAK
jgi:hypothetical protein